MKFIRFLFTVVLVALLGITSSQAQDKKVEFGVMAGYGHTMPKLKNSGNNNSPSIDLGNLNGFHVGPILKFNFSEQVGFQTGLLFNYFSGINIDASQLAWKKKDGNYFQYRTNLNAFDLPLRIVYTVPLADEFNVFIFGGPSLNYSLNKTTTKQQYSNNVLQQSQVHSNIYETDEYNPLDLQLGGGFGIKWVGISIRASYDWGVLNRTNIENIGLRSNDIKVSLAYTF